MSVITLPGKKELFTAILMDAGTPEQLGKDAFDEAIKYALEEYSDATLEEIKEGEGNIQDNMYGFTCGYLKAKGSK